MDITLGFARDVVACAVLGIMLWAACAGIGYRILPRATSPRPEGEPATWRQPGIAACVGLSALVMLGGITVLFRIPWWLLVVPFLVVGIVLAIRELSGFDFRSTPRPVRIIGGIGAAAFVLVALIEAVPGLRFAPNVCDDLRAYLPLAHRLVDTNGLVEPWSARRLQNLGGFTFLQALPVAVFGHAGLAVVETVVASIFLGGLFVANGLRSTWARVFSVGLLLAIPLLWVPRVNTTGVLMGIPLLIAVFASAVELRKALRGASFRVAARWAVAGGLITAALTSVRPPLGVLAVLTLSLGVLVGHGTAIRGRVQLLLVAGASALVATVPWSIASWQTVRTPLYPLVKGNQNVDSVRALHYGSLLNVADRAIELLRFGPYLWLAVGVLVIALVVHKLLPDVQLVALAATATGFTLVAFALNESLSPRQAFIRYVAPMSGALTVFLVCELLRNLDSAQGRERAPRPVWARWVAVVAALGLAAVAFTNLDLSLEGPVIPGGANLIGLGVRNELLPEVRGLEVSTPTLTTAYKRALVRLDPGTTIAAVDRPYLIDYSRYDIPSMDLAGFTAPDGKFPFLTGPGPKIARLRAAGYDTLLATAPDTDACLRPWVLRGQRQAGVPNYSAYARYYLDWADDVNEIALKAPDAVQVFGPLFVIDLRKAQRELQAQGS